MSAVMNHLRQVLLDGARQHQEAVDDDDEEVRAVRRRFKDKKWRLDRGAGYYQEEREKKKMPSLVQTGRYVVVGPKSRPTWASPHAGPAVPWTKWGFDTHNHQCTSYRSSQHTACSAALDILPCQTTRLPRDASHHVHRPTVAANHGERAWQGHGMVCRAAELTPSGPATPAQHPLLHLCTPCASVVAGARAAPACSTWASTLARGGATC